MTNFDEVLQMAIEQYAELSGETVDSIVRQCQDFNSQTAKNVQMLMFAAL